MAETLEKWRSSSYRGTAVIFNGIDKIGLMGIFEAAATGELFTLEPIIYDNLPKLEIIGDPKAPTSKPGVWAGGDIVTGSATVIPAMGAGRKVANSIHEYLMKK